MLVKWVRCVVTDRSAFDRGQLAWAGLRVVPGFLGQCGGWDTGAAGDTAHLLGCWADQDSYQAFMCGPHDSLADAQAGSYRGTDVSVFQRRLTIGSGLTGGDGALRLAHCRVLPGRVGHFTEVQQTVWNPGMGADGLFGQRGEHEFLVATRWPSVAAHQRYQHEVFPGLRDRAEPGTDLAEITGYLVALEPRWWVPPTDSRFALPGR